MLPKYTYIYIYINIFFFKWIGPQENLFLIYLFFSKACFSNMWILSLGSKIILLPEDDVKHQKHVLEKNKWFKNKFFCESIHFIVFTFFSHWTKKKVIYIYIYVCVCVCVYVYIYVYTELAMVLGFSIKLFAELFLHFKMDLISDLSHGKEGMGKYPTWGILEDLYFGLSLSLYIYIYIYINGHFHKFLNRLLWRGGKSLHLFRKISNLLKRRF